MAPNQKHTLKLEMRHLADLRPHPENYRKHSGAQIEVLRTSLRTHGLQKPIIISGDDTILAGHGLVEAALLEKWDEIACHVYDGPNPEAFLVMDNRSALLAEDDDGALSALLERLNTQEGGLVSSGYSSEDFSALVARLTGGGSHFRPGQGFPTPELLAAEDWGPTDEVREWANGFDHFIFDYSGGRDSTAALLWAATFFPEKHILAVYSDVGVEFPGLSGYVGETVERLGCELRVVKPKADWWNWLRLRGKWPSLLFRECQERFIWSATREVRREFDPEKALLLDGSRSKQAGRGSRKTKTARLGTLPNYEAYHPVFDLSDEAVTAVLESNEIPLWRGYAQGFTRTACWCCPCQRGSQALALQRNFPGLADTIRYWEGKIGPLRPFVKHKDAGDFVSFDMMVARGEKGEPDPPEEEEGEGGDLLGPEGRSEVLDPDAGVAKGAAGEAGDVA